MCRSTQKSEAIEGLLKPLRLYSIITNSWTQWPPSPSPTFSHCSRLTVHFLTLWPFPRWEHGSGQHKNITRFTLREIKISQNLFSIESWVNVIITLWIISHFSTHIQYAVLWWKRLQCLITYEKYCENTGLKQCCMNLHDCRKSVNLLFMAHV